MSGSLYTEAEVVLAPQITTQSFSTLVGTAAVTVYTTTQITANRLSFIRCWNVSASGGATIWLMRSATLGLGITAGAPGAFPLAPGQSEVFALPGAIPTNSLFAIATAAGAALTVELG